MVSDVFGPGGWNNVYAMDFIHGHMMDAAAKRNSSVLSLD
jgi:hypothetical protein